jgi:two-component system chemotaxis response regulator CheB
MDKSMNVGLKKILLINCDSDTVESLTGFLNDDPGSYHLITSDADENAFAILVTEDIFLVVIFIDAQHQLSHIFLQRIIANYSQLEIILALPPDQNQLGDTITSHSRLHILEKPYESSSVGRLIKKLSSNKQNQGFTGSLEIVQLDDLLQMCCLAGTTVTIQVNNDLQQGAIYIKNGEIFHAQCGDISGEEALYLIMTWRHGDFETLDVTENDTVTTINANYQYLLLEAARLRDESNRELETEDDLTLATEADSAEPDKLRVLIVDDSMIMTKIMSTILLVAGDIEVAGIARNGREALEMMEILQFDVILLDVNMPVMNGRVTMKNIMIKSPCPIVIMSNVGSGSLDTILSLLDLGVVDFISKPVRGGDILLQQRKIVERVRRAATARTSMFRRFRRPKNVRSQALCEQKRDIDSPVERLVIISSGCSGHGALYHLVTGMPETTALSFISLHSIPVTFLDAMAKHISRLGHHSVTPVADGAALQNNHFYLDAQRRSLSLQATDKSLIVRSLQEKHDSGFGLSYFDLLLFSAADSFQDKLLIVLLSGAETGNLEGLRYVREKCGSIFVQNRSSCLIHDFMPAMVQENLINEEIKPEALAKRIVTWADR